MKIIGITGTVGKTTCVNLLHNYLINSNYNVLSTSTSGLKYNNKKLINDIATTVFTEKNVFRKSY